MSGNVQILSYTDHFYAYCGLVMVYQTMKTIRKVPKHFNDVKWLPADKNEYKPTRHTSFTRYALI